MNTRCATCGIDWLGRFMMMSDKWQRLEREQRVAALMALADNYASILRDAAGQWSVIQVAEVRAVLEAAIRRELT